MQASLILNLSALASLLPASALAWKRPLARDGLFWMLLAVAVAGSAVAAVPARGPSWAYISSGTWSLMGAELPAPLIDDRVLRYNFTNEGGVGGTIRFLKNIMGLWLVQECRRVWERAGQSFTYEELMRQAEAAPPGGEPSEAFFLAPPSSGAPATTAGAQASESVAPPPAAAAKHSSRSGS